jgi:hypothetical protein
MCLVCGERAGYISYPDTYTGDKMWHKCNNCRSKWTTSLEKKETRKIATRIDLTPKLISAPLEPMTFFNHMEEVTIPEVEIQILKDVQKLHQVAYSFPQENQISLKILKIQIVRHAHSIGLKFAKDIVEYLDATVLK